MLSKTRHYIRFEIAGTVARNGVTLTAEQLHHLVGERWPDHYASRLGLRLAKTP